MPDFQHFSPAQKQNFEFRDREVNREQPVARSHSWSHYESKNGTLARLRKLLNGADAEMSDPILVEVDLSCVVDACVL